MILVLVTKQTSAVSYYKSKPFGACALVVIFLCFVINIMHFCCLN